VAYQCLNGSSFSAAGILGGLSSRLQLLFNAVWLAARATRSLRDGCLHHGISQLVLRQHFTIGFFGGLPACRSPRRHSLGAYRLALGLVGLPLFVLVACLLVRINVARDQRSCERHSAAARR